ncbi:MAG: hypothetical protein HN368_21755, partial [Spirochaetales bacterium]|nr:hypothetical protein [Spirochaetales bacterium]
MSQSAEILLSLDEPFASGYYELPEAPPAVRWSRAVRRELEHRTLPDYNGGWLYPAGPSILRAESRISRFLRPNLVTTWMYNSDALTAKKATASPEEYAVLEKAEMDFRQLQDDLRPFSGEHAVGGAGYIHCVPNYQRVLQEGFSVYQNRIAAEQRHAEASGDLDKAGFEAGLADVLEGVKSWHKNIMAKLEKPFTENEISERRRFALAKVYNRIPWEPATNFAEAMAFYNFVFYLDYCDNPGRIDQVLNPYYEDDLAKGLIDRETARLYFDEFTDLCCLNDSWSAALGGTAADGSYAYNDLTIICLEAVRSRHRPNYQLRIHPDMPGEIWDAALDSLESGCGQPALYNEQGYYSSLAIAEPTITAEDMSWWNGGGCTETMIQGLSNVGSLDSGLNLLLVLERTLRQHLPGVESFEQLVTAFTNNAVTTVDEIVHDLNRLFAARG